MTIQKLLLLTCTLKWMLATAESIAEEQKAEAEENQQMMSNDSEEEEDEEELV